MKKNKVLSVLGWTALAVMALIMFICVCCAWSEGVKMADSITDTKSVPLLVLDKEEHKDVVTTGKIFFTRRYYSITVELEDGTPYEFKCSKSEYNAVEIGETANFIVSFSNRNGYIFSVKPEGGY